MTQSHVRTQLRAAVAALLTPLVASSASVLIGRRRPTRDSQMPALLVFTDDETGERISTDELARHVELAVRVRLTSTGEPPQDLLDAMAARVEVALMVDPTLGRLVKNLVYSRTHGGLPSPMTDRQPGEIDIVYIAEVHTTPGDPTTAV